MRLPLPFLLELTRTPLCLQTVTGADTHRRVGLAVSRTHHRSSTQKALGLKLPVCGPQERALPSPKRGPSSICFRPLPSVLFPKVTYTDPDSM